eukprot:CAMPEP_0178567224 /NCGR_PEP_ID=MMETSP0697-20121206/15205_1 /TAXON_ID=265572 /ORGANISM="Extubocellulus spinifer, Strain CCMP396" /LENGTH=84 /DNA_ID=CAMNT_0020201131 /DNA_START=514 /DNA_END=769 /DNA_ORIENTATION=+
MTEGNWRVSGASHQPPRISGGDGDLDGGGGGGGGGGRIVSVSVATLRLAHRRQNSREVVVVILQLNDRINNSVWRHLGGGVSAA